MPEIKKKLIKLGEGSTYTATGDDYVITEDHTTFDILRFIVQKSSIEELKYFVSENDWGGE